MKEASDPQQKWLVEKNHFVCKKRGEQVFVIDEITEISVVFKHTPLFGDEEIVEVLHKDIKEWKATKDGKMPSICAEESWSKYLPEHLQSSNQKF